MLWTVRNADDGMPNALSTCALVASQKPANRSIAVRSPSRIGSILGG